MITSLQSITLLFHVIVCTSILNHHNIWTYVLLYSHTEPNHFWINYIISHLLLNERCTYFDFSFGRNGNLQSSSNMVLSVQQSVYQVAVWIAYHPMHLLQVAQCIMKSWLEMMMTDYHSCLQRQAIISLLCMCLSYNWALPGKSVQWWGLFNKCM